jgi:hypothetical protein
VCTNTCLSSTLPTPFNKFICNDPSPPPPHRCAPREEEFQERLRSLSMAPSETAAPEQHRLPKARRQCKKRRHADVTNSMLWCKNDEGVACRRDPRATEWCREHVSEVNTTSTSFQQKFRARFRLPHAAFTSLVSECKRAGWFVKHEPRRARGLEQPHPLELCILGAMRCIGRGWVLGDLEEATKMSLSQHQRFWRTF